MILVAVAILAFIREAGVRPILIASRIAAPVLGLLAVLQDLSLIARGEAAAGGSVSFAVKAPRLR